MEAPGEAEVVSLGSVSVYAKYNHMKVTGLPTVALQICNEAFLAFAHSVK